MVHARTSRIDSSQALSVKRLTPSKRKAAPRRSQPRLWEGLVQQNMLNPTKRIWDLGFILPLSNCINTMNRKLVRDTQADYVRYRPDSKKVRCIPAPEAAKDEANMILRRRQQQDAMACLHSKLSPEEKEIRRKQSRDFQQKRHANIFE